MHHCHHDLVGLVAHDLDLPAPVEPHQINADPMKIPLHLVVSLVVVVVVVVKATAAASILLLV